MLTRTDVRNTKRTLSVFCILVGFLIADVMINYVNDLVVPYLITIWSVIFFVVLACICNYGRYFILNFTRQISKDIVTKDRYLNLIQQVITLAQYTLIALLTTIVLEIILTSQYHTDLLLVVNALSNILVTGILGFFAYRFISWFNRNRQAIVILLYGLFFSLTAFSYAILSPDDIGIILGKEKIRTQDSEVVYPSSFEVPNPLSDLLFNIHGYTDVLAFCLLVIATAMLLHHYSRKIGRIKFWILVLLPLVYFASTQIEFFGLYTPVTDSEWFYWYLYISLNSTAGGILFGIAFWTISKTLRQDSAAKQYLRITAFGFILLFISNQAYVVAAGYPPYGLVTQSFMSLASYMIFLGLHSTAVSISQDTKLRQSIKKLATQDANLLGSIGTAQMEQEIERTVNGMKNVVAEQEKELEEQTGIEANLEEDEMKNYLEEVMQEVGKAKKPST